MAIIHYQARRSTASGVDCWSTVSSDSAGLAVGETQGKEELWRFRSEPNTEAARFTTRHADFCTPPIQLSYSG